MWIFWEMTSGSVFAFSLLLGSTAVRFMSQRYRYSAVSLQHKTYVLPDRNFCLRHEGVLFQPEVLRLSTNPRYCAETARRILKVFFVYSTRNFNIVTLDYIKK